MGEDGKDDVGEPAGLFLWRSPYCSSTCSGSGISQRASEPPAGFTCIVCLP